jgi:hypothetical protein
MCLKHCLKYGSLLLSFHNEIFVSYNADYAKLSGNGVPTGTLIDFAGSTAPDGYLVCDGSAVSRATYADLFKVIGTLYGAGDGSSTFALPNLIDRVKQGASTAGTYKEAGLPNITGRIVAWGARSPFGSEFAGSIYGSTEDTMMANVGTTAPSMSYDILNFDASRSSGIYGKSDTVQMAALCVLPCIKY